MNPVDKEIEQLESDLVESFWGFLNEPRNHSHTKTACTVAAKHFVTRFQAREQVAYERGKAEGAREEIEAWKHESIEADNAYLAFTFSKKRLAQLDNQEKQ